jgi:hypothetical protein
MTVCGWDEIGHLECRQRVHQALAGFERACGGWFRACGVTVRHSGDGKCIRLDARSVEPAGPWAVLRDALLAITGKQRHEPTDDKLHINLGWYKLWSPPRNQEGFASRSLDPALAALQAALARIPAVGAVDGSLPGLRVGELPLRCPHLSHYSDMATFPRNCEPAAIAPGPGAVLARTCSADQRALVVEWLRLVPDLEAKFRKIDINGDGVVSCSELERAVAPFEAKWRALPAALQAMSGCSAAEGIPLANFLRLGKLLQGNTSLRSDVKLELQPEPEPEPETQVS